MRLQVRLTSRQGSVETMAVERHVRLRYSFWRASELGTDQIFRREAQ